MEFIQLENLILGAMKVFLCALEDKIKHFYSYEEAILKSKVGCH